MPASLDDVRRLAADYNLIPLTRTLLADLHTPVGAYLSAVRGRRARYAYLLESVEGGERLGRYSFLGLDPDFLLRQRRGRVARGDGRSWTPVPGSLLDLARAEVRRRRIAPALSASAADAASDGAAPPPPFLAGAVGYLAYDMVRSFERLPASARNDLGGDEALLMFFSRQVIFDHVRRQITLVACIDTACIDAACKDAAAAPSSLEAEYARACADLDAMAARLARTPRPPRSAPEPGPMPLVPNQSREAFEHAVRRAKAYIEAGDVFQVVLSQRFDVATPVDPFQVYRALRVINPSPYMFYLQLGRDALVGASPELLVQIQGNDILYRPIAGTRPRGHDEPSDTELSRELLADEKERSEHIMLVDLGRNDVGRVATTGSVTVPALMSVEKYSHVQHLVSDVRGRLDAPRCDMLDALAACFPAGTLSGAPKVRAMQIIEELEPTRRGTYGGAVVNFDYRGNLSSCILIRSILFRRQCAHIQAGAGIVADSVPEREYIECVNKAGAMLRALERARAGL